MPRAPNNLSTPMVIGYFQSKVNSATQVKEKNTVSTTKIFVLFVVSTINSNKFFAVFRVVHSFIDK